MVKTMGKKPARSAKTRTVAASLLSLVLAATLLPVMPGSASEAQAAAIGSPAGLVSGDNLTGSPVYLGEHGGQPLLWNVVETDARGVTLWTKTSVGQLQYNANGNQNWGGSSLATALNNETGGTLSSVLDAGEWAALVPYSEVAEQGATGPGTMTPNQKVVLPSVAEMGELMTTGTWGVNSTTRQSLGAVSWLRTPGLNNRGTAYAIQRSGNVFGLKPIAEQAAVRPVVKVGNDNILLTSATDGTGKDAVAVGTGFERVSGTSAGTPVKLTLRDDAANTAGLSLASATLSAATAAPGDALTVTFGGATAGTGRYVSAVLTSATGTATHYAKLSAFAGGTAQITLPADLPGGNYKLRVFNELAAAGTGTDFASAPIDNALTVTSEGPDGTGATDVFYNTSTIIPGTANWGVQIPKAITFTEMMSKDIVADVKLVNMDGGSIGDIQQLPAGGAVAVSVASTKGMVMDIDGETEPEQKDAIPYKITFTGALPTDAGAELVLDSTNGTAGTDVPMARLTKTNSEVKGTALRGGIANSNGSHDDLLTFKFDNGL